MKKYLYTVKYETRWNGDRIEEAEVNVVATDLEKAIEKASNLVAKEKLKDMDGSELRRVHFRALEAYIVNQVNS